jgi:hypothetical protein
MDIMSRQTYLIIAAGVAVVVFLVGTFFGQTIAPWVGALPAYAVGGWANLAAIIIEPVKFAMLNPLLGAIIIGLLWPFAALDLFLVILVVLLVAASGVVIQIDTQTPLKVK